MNIMEMTKADFAAVPELDLCTEWEKLATNDGHLEFRAFVIIPVERDGAIDLHDSGWGCMEFCLVNGKMEPIGRIGGGSDVINLDGIGGYGSHKNRDWGRFPFLIPAKGWSIDCLPCGYLHVWTRRTLFLEDRYVCSNFEVYSEDLPRQKKEE